MPSSMQMQSISGIITQTHVTTDEVPPPLVGASVDIIEDKVYVFAGRLASSRKLTNYLYVLDLNTLSWSRHIPPPDSDKPPKVRYFHSTSIYKNQLIIFGGMGYNSRNSSEGLCVLDDVMILDIETMCWRKTEIEPSLYSPQARYAHLSSIQEDKLLIIGGQDLDNNYLDELNVLNLKTWEWEQVKTLDKHVGAYRSVAVAAPSGVRIPPSTTINTTEENNTTTTDENNDENNDEPTKTGDNVARPLGFTSLQEENLVYLYTNYNFTDVKRELQVILSSPQVAIEDCSKYMNGSAMPPGLRFPSGHTLGNHLILAGTYLSPQSQVFTIWALDFSKFTWSRIETGAMFNSGSWNRGVLYEKTNKYIVFGNSNRSLVDDYNHRQMNFDHIAFVDLEAFGVYALPKSTCSSLAQEMGLRLLNEPAVSDFNIITQDNQTIPVNSAVLSQRWPYFANLMKDNQVNSKRSSQTKEKEDTEKEKIEETSSEEVMIKSRYMSFPYPHSVVVALLQFIYTDNLLTAQQYQPHILSQLLLLSDMYDIPRLRELSTHALHQMLNMSTAPLIFETAALSHQTSLQIRALKMMIAAKKMIQQQQLQQQHAVRSRTVSTPAVVSSPVEHPPVSPTASLSSSSYQNNESALKLSHFDQNPPPSRQPSINQQRASTISGLYTPKTTYSPPSTPGQQRSYSPSELELNSYTPRRSSSPPKPLKEKKKKKAFLEAFGKFSISK